LIWRMLDWFLNTTASSEIASVECGFDIGTNETSFFSRYLAAANLFSVRSRDVASAHRALRIFNERQRRINFGFIRPYRNLYYRIRDSSNNNFCVCVCANILWNILCFRDSCEVVNISKWRVARRIRHADNFSLLCERATNKFRGLKKLIFDIIFCSEAIELTSLAANLM
jgi:hypothetical protein